MVMRSGCWRALWLTQTCVKTCRGRTKLHAIPSTAREELSRHWPLILAVMLGSGIGPTVLVPYTMGVFVTPLQDAFGWSRGMVSLGVTVFLGTTALMAPLAGGLADRYGVRLMLPASLLVTAAAFALLGAFNGSYVLFLLMFGLLGVLGAGATTLIMSRILTGAFDKARGTALGLGLLGIGVTGMVGPALLSGVVEARGWRSAYVSLGALVILALPFVVLPVWRRGESPQAQKAEATRSTIGTALRESVFWKLAAAFFLIQVSVTGVLVHFIPMLRDRGTEPAEAAIVAGAIGAVMIVSRLVVGVVIDRVFAPIVAFVVSIAAAGGFAMLAWGGSSGALFGAIAAGFVIGAEFDLAAYLVSRYFPQQIFGRLYGLLFTVMVVGNMVSTTLYGFWADWSGSYDQVLAAATFGLLCSAAVFLALPRFSNAHQKIA